MSTTPAGSQLAARSSQLPRPVRAVVWDFDGTLVDSPAAVQAATNAALAEQGFPAADLDAVKAGMVKATIPRMAGHAGIADDDPRAQRLCADFYRHSAALFPRTAQAFAGIPAALRALGVPQAVVTNNHGTIVRDTLRRLGLLDAFATVLGDGDLPAPKPDPRGPWMAAAACGVAPDACVYVGDSAVDRDTARAAGMQAIGVTWGTTARAGLHGFDRLVDAPAELVAALRP